MRIGVISDTHDNFEKTKEAVSIFKSEKVDKVIHLGDFVKPEIVYLFEGFDLSAVLGNNDKDIDGFIKAFNDIKGNLEMELLLLEIDGISICCYHGTKSVFRKRIIESRKYNVFLYGHTHNAENKKIGKTLCVNPGALKRVIKPSIAILDTITRKAEHIWF